VIRWIKVACVLFGALGLASLMVIVAAWLPAGYLYVIIKRPPSRSPYCTAWDLARQFHITQRYAEAAAALQSRLRIVRKEGSLQLVETPDGNFWMPHGPLSTLATLLAQQHGDIYGDAETGVRAGDVVIDCGAHIGVFVYEALQRGASLIVAVEPTPLSVECLRRNFAREIEAGRVKICPKGVWDSDGVLTLYSNANAEAGNSFVLRGEGATIAGQIPVTTIDGIAAEYRLPRVDFIKADIKGAACRMLSGARQTIARDSPRFAVSTEEADDPRAVIQTIQAIAPRYQPRLGPCRVAEHVIYTDTVFLRPRP
jgi:FkbM family methyltransferase